MECLNSDKVMKFQTFILARGIWQSRSRVAHNAHILNKVNGDNFYSLFRDLCAIYLIAASRSHCDYYYVCMHNIAERSHCFVTDG